jgi:hypothetical protein
MDKSWSVAMNLTPDNKAHIDGLSYESLLRHNRFAPAGDDWFQGETGTYWLKRMAEKRSEDSAEAVAASKRIGWEGR